MIDLYAPRPTERRVRLRVGARTKESLGVRLYAQLRSRARPLAMLGAFLLASAWAVTRVAARRSRPAWQPRSSGLLVVALSVLAGPIAWLIAPALVGDPASPHAPGVIDHLAVWLYVALVLAVAAWLCLPLTGLRELALK